MAESTKITTLDIKDVLAIVRRRKWLIVLPLILVTAVAFGGSYFLTKQYRSSTMVLTEQTRYLSKQIQAMVPGMEDDRYSDAQRRSRLIAIHNEIISTTYLSRLIDELGMADDPVLQRQAQKLHRSHPDVPVKNLVYHIAIQNLRNSIDVDFNGENIIEISAESSDPEQAMTIATKLAEIFKDERLKSEMSSVRGALDFSDEQLSIYRANLDDAERKKADFAAQFIKNKLDESISSESNIHAITADIDNLKLLIEDNINEQTTVRSQLSEYKKSDLDFDLGKRYNDLKSTIFSETERLASLMSKYTWSDPKVLNANLKINNQLQDMEAIVGDQVDSKFTRSSANDRHGITRLLVLQTREMVLRKKLDNFEVSLSTLRNRIAQQPQIEIQMRNLENDVASAREIYEKFKDQVTGSEISQSLMRGEAESKYRIIEPASMPMAPVKPNRVKITVLGGILGLVIGGAAALLAELLDNSFRKVEEVEEFLGASVLATIPGIESIKGKVKVR
jgi:succinoglycan biosynthesis transport protein ExoP